ncbi:hypothetical protein D3C75_1300860 [compost metagenome]
MRQRAGFSGGMDIDGGNTALGVNAAAQCAAAVNDRNTDLRFRWLTFFKTIYRLPAS